MRTKLTRFNWLARVAAIREGEKQKSMLWTLAYHSDTVGNCYPAVATLARESGCGDPRTARRRLRKLEAAGLIKITARSVPFNIGGRTLYVNRYTLTLPPETPERPDTALSGHSKEMTGQNRDDDRTKHDNDRTKHDNDRTQLCPPKPIESPFLKPILKPKAKKPPRALGHTDPDYAKTKPPNPKERLKPDGLPAELSDIWGSWVQHRQEIKKPLTSETIKRQVAFLNQYDPTTARSIVEQSVRQGWQGLFPLNNKGQHDGDPNQRRAEKANREYPEQLRVRTL